MFASELLSKESKDLFWDFIDHWKELDRGSECLTAKCCAQKIVEDARTLLNEPLSSIFEFSLTLRSASPRLVLYRQLAEESLSSISANDSLNRVSGHGTGENFDEASGSSSSGGTCCWEDTGKFPLFNSADLREWLEGLGNLAIDSTEQPELFDFDHVYPRANITAPVAIFYGAVGTKCFKELHAQLAEASKQGKVRYALRPVLPSGCQATSSFCGSIGAVDAVTLSGYGVELALKNMEYKAMDDTAIKKGVPLEDPKTEDLSQEVRGKRKPELNTEIMAFRDYLLSSTVSDTLEVWELKDLGHQTAQRIVQASDPLQSMQEINQNFPSIVSSLSRMKLEDSIKDEIIANQRMVPPGKSLMALNGALINIEDLDLYLLMDMVHGELSLADQFVRLKLPQSAARKILSAPPPAESNSFRVDFRSSHVHYLNNLEEDAMYRRWRSNLQEIHKSRNGEDDYNEDLVEALHVEGAFVDSLLSSAKSHPQDVLLKLQKENMYKEEAEESSRFVYKLGLYKLQCCLLMNGLVHESNEVINTFGTKLLHEAIRYLLSGFLFGQLGLVFGSNAVITNGRVSFMVHVYTRLVFVMNEGEPFLANDLGLLESIEYDLRTKYIFEIIEEVEFIGVDPDDLTSQFYSDTAMLVSSSMSVREWPSERAHFEILHAEHSAIKLNNENSSHCMEKDRDPPRGLQFILGTKQRPHLVDTLVMANLGYWQMKVSPGVWYLQLAPGRSADLYELPPKLVAIDSLRGKLMHIEVQKKKGKEREELLNAADDHHFQEKTDNKGWNNNLLKWASSLISGDASSKNQADKVTDRKDARQGETINIFSVASGHLYERFLKIMILSVLKKTQRPVKFWFIKNYLSPQFKVIFVDADQIVRADMGELYDMNLKGRPLAYTPFCDNNKDMDGYRFWKQVSHLQKIIALYVVDLAKFRQTASGDTLRVFYEQLSKDPNSLSNLDQDLPNYAQHTVPIFSLPQEWLWCESWCGNATKARAKTIDLCNNPMTKEPKLQGARRIVPEWVGLDSEARQFTARILGDGLESAEGTPPSSETPKPDDKDTDQNVKDEL
ncbi:hypothetical protein HU200_049459 [Digitaria exilis]|uniref:UDP-glucose:glycoprotein glucosyltransferase n=1 Tax=Digitaria exilis TaxID=1010633 RepID=A0A835E8G7_9POAL|nr:hypothetical protein HU200_049459 [Digitaria exilis]